MADRSRRMRRQISEVTEVSPEVSDADSEDFDPRKSDSQRRGGGRYEAPASPASRSKRTTANVSASLSPQTSNNGDSKQSIRLTMKVAPSKLREVMRANEVDALKDTLGGGTVLDGPRSRRSATQTRAVGRPGSRPTYVEPRESDLEDDEDEEEEEDEEDEDDAEPEDTTMNDFDEIGAEAEGGTDDDDEEEDDDNEEEEDEEEEEDVEMEDEPPPPPPMRKGPIQPKAPKITLKTPTKKAQGAPTRPSVIVTPADVGPVQSVEDAEMEDDPDDDDLEDVSELPDDEDETNLNEEEAEGEDEELEGEGEGEGEDEELDEDEEDEDEDDDDELGDSDEDGGASGTGTPDPTKMTSRQRGRPVEPLLALDMAPQQRKFFTDEEKAMKKDEHARKRKELTKRKTQEEKTAALNRLLKPQVSKTRGAAPKAETLAAQMQAVAEEEEVEQKADPLFTRWVSTKDGVKLGVPDEWLGKRVGSYFGPPLTPRNGALVQEVE